MIRHAAFLPVLMPHPETIVVAPPMFFSFTVE